MKNVDFVIEAVTENEDVKKSIFQKLDEVRPRATHGRNQRDTAIAAADRPGPFREPRPRARALSTPPRS